MQTTTKDKIVEIGAEIIHQKGYHHTGIQEILNKANVPKGSFYNYFRSKEDFGLQIIDRFLSHFDQMAKDILENTSIAPLKRIDRFLIASMDHFQSTDYTGGCPIGNLAQEMGDLSSAFRKKLSAAMDSMVKAYSKVLAEAQRVGELSENLDVTATAYFIVAGWHGAIIQMKLVKDLAPLENHRQFISDYILKM
ncbi:MAG: TetR family transcriptional regulator C-terminal domain-containing protein [Desulfobacterales bacterium]|jgi:TetR/AcrR family transcriptional repressor of nem operon